MSFRELWGLFVLVNVYPFNFSKGSPTRGILARAAGVFLFNASRYFVIFHLLINSFEYTNYGLIDFWTFPR